MPGSPSTLVTSEAAASLGLLAVVAVWAFRGPESGPVESPVALVALGVLCARVLAAAVADLTRPAPAADLAKPQWRLSELEDARAPTPTTARSIAYTPFAVTPLPPGTRAPTPATISVADKLDTSLSVFDFIPIKYHAAIRLNKRIDAGNVDVTQWFQAAIDFVGQNGGPGQTPLVSLVINVPAGRFYVSNILLAHGITLRGQAIQSTMLCPVPGTKGSWLKNYTSGPPSGTLSTVAFSQSSYILMTYRVVGTRTWQCRQDFDRAHALRRWRGTGHHRGDRS